VSKKRLGLSGWLKDIAPTTKLRKWYAHDDDRWPEFAERYRQELEGANQKRLLSDLANKARDGDITLVFATHIPERSGAYVLAKVLEQVLRRSLRHRRATGSLEGREASGRAAVSRLVSR
jgi:uncharacterized protein YeaO (DUF488 family)